MRTSLINSSCTWSENRWSAQNGSRVLSPQTFKLDISGYFVYRKLVLNSHTVLFPSGFDERLEKTFPGCSLSHVLLMDVRWHLDLPTYSFGFAHSPELTPLCIKFFLVHQDAVDVPLVRCSLNKAGCQELYIMLLHAVYVFMNVTHIEVAKDTQG